MDLFWIILGAGFLFSLFVKQRLHAAYRKWGRIQNSANITGATTSRVILDSNGLQNVVVTPIPGELGDHYDPRTRSIALSQTVFGVPSVAAMAVAAHEVGHAIQHKVGYWPLAVRTAAAPLVNAGARFGIPAAFVGLILGIPLLIQLGVISYVGALAFQFLTLPLEFDASRRALSELERLQLLNEEEKSGARSILRAAAMTYVAGVASSAAYIVYLALLGGRWLFGKTPPVAPPRLP